MKDRSLKALNGHLHDQLEKIMNPDLSEDELKTEISRGKAITEISNVIIDGERVVNERAKLVAEHAPKKLVDLLLPNQIFEGVTHEKSY